MDLAPFRSVLEKNCGLVFENEKAALLEAGIHARMNARKIHSPFRYLSLIRAEREEFGRLVDLLTINETYFYRDPIHFALLAGRLVPELRATKGPSAKIRILSAGCSTGEEAYSIVIALAERLDSDVLDGISVIGVDIDATAITAAGEGVFGKRSFRDFPHDLQKRYFEQCADGNFRIRQWLRNLVEFYPFNLLSDDYPPELREIDVIFYRNVSIYFSHEVRRKIFGRLAGILNPGGHLFVSPSETFFYNRGLLSLTVKDGAFLYRNLPTEVCRETRDPSRNYRYPLTGKPNSSKQSAPERFRLPESPANHGKVQGASGEDGRRLRRDFRASVPGDKPAPAALDAIRRRAEAGNYEESLRNLEMLITDFPVSLDAHCMKGFILLNLSRFEEARESYCTVLEIDRFCLDAAFSLGMIARLQRNDDDALRRFREAVYIRPSCWPAHFFLAETHLERVETDHARREYEVILKILDKGDFPNHGLGCLPLAFSARQLETLCHRKLDLVKGERYGA
ncbi:MAG TPA: CheR family methyltransferase [Geobacteraceae bacterium]|nr:CheR family methyltransferase [Geobacteraceae bacterium]